MEDLVRLDCVQKSKHTVALRRETASGSDFAMGRERLTRYRWVYYVMSGLLKCEYILEWVFQV